jgi:hypothetical protein
MPQHTLLECRSLPFRYGLYCAEDSIEMMVILLRATNDTNSTVNDIWPIRSGRMLAELDGSPSHQASVTAEVSGSIRCK